MSWSSSSGSEEEDEGMDSYREGGYHAVRVGDTFSGGRYVAQRELGWGQFSTVWLAYDTQTSEYVVLKIQKSVPESALHEIQVLSTLTGFDPDNTEHVICLLEWSSTFDMGQSSHAPPLTPATIALPVIAARISRVDAQVQTVSRELTNVEDKTRATLVRIRRLEEDRNLIEEVIQLTRDELAATKARLHSLEERMTALEQRALAAEARATAAEARATATEARATAAEQKAIEVTLAVSEMTERLSRHLGV